MPAISVRTNAAPGSSFVGNENSRSARGALNCLRTEALALGITPGTLLERDWMFNVELPVSILHSLFRRFRQQEPDEKSDDGDARGHKARGLGDVGRQERPIAREHRCDEVRGDKGHAGAKHSTADVGGEAAARPAQVQRKSLWQVLAEVAELRNRKQTANEITPQESLAPLAEQREISQRQNDQGRHLKDF